MKRKGRATPSGALPDCPWKVRFLFKPFFASPNDQSHEACAEEHQGARFRDRWGGVAVHSVPNMIVAPVKTVSEVIPSIPRMNVAV